MNKKGIDERFLLRRVASWHLERKKNGRPLKINFPFPSYSNNNSGKKYVSLFKITPLFTSNYFIAGKKKGRIDERFLLRRSLLPGILKGKKMGVP